MAAMPGSMFFSSKPNNPKSVLRESGFTALQQRADWQALEAKTNWTAAVCPPNLLTQLARNRPKQASIDRDRSMHH